jgi:hypothetical protein
MSADGVDVLRRMTERQEEARQRQEEIRRNVYGTSSHSEGGTSWFETLGALLLLAILLFILGSTGSTP